MVCFHLSLSETSPNEMDDGERNEREEESESEKYDEDKLTVIDEDGVNRFLPSLQSKQIFSDGINAVVDSADAATSLPASGDAALAAAGAASLGAGLCYHATASAAGDRKLFLVGGESRLNRVMNSCLLEIDIAHFCF